MSKSDASASEGKIQIEHPNYESTEIEIVGNAAYYINPESGCQLSFGTALTDEESITSGSNVSVQIDQLPIEVDKIINGSKNELVVDENDLDAHEGIPLGLVFMDVNFRVRRVSLTFLGGGVVKGELRVDDIDELVDDPITKVGFCAKFVKSDSQLFEF